MTVAVVPGSFDPPTLGHVDVISRAVEVFDRVLIAVVANPSKTPLFSSAERIEMLTDICADWPNAEVDAFDGLLVEFARDRGAVVIVKGLRAVADFEYELQMAQMNQHLSGVQTVFLPTSPEHAYLSSSLVKEVARFGSSLEGLVPPVVATALKERFQ
ncbi:MAG: pantetheine-phosphate adenylyltransferase [Acidimicrobiia bacterium]|nr:pantetheine-phosphate adenylyltransferase [Acidimicrobiia bacterium]NNF09993.1 pantetheine-phosphate adenylyltransferase [Acidimicrobiia bacterium]NNL70691.1 pantetheine-phosphate adenylyltransferase [Acidimicrobiia bacterium]